MSPPHGVAGAVSQSQGAGESTIVNATVADAAQTSGDLRNRLKTFLIDLRAALRHINLTGLAAQVSYSLIFAMPSILLIVALVALAIDRQTGYAISDEVKVLVIATLPPGVQPVVTGLIDEAVKQAREGPSKISSIVAIAVALFAAGNGLGELATAFDRAAEIDDSRPDWQKRFIFTGSAVLIGLVLVVAFTLYVWGGGLVALLAQRFGLAGDWERGWLALEIPFIILLVFVGTTLLYMTSSGRYCFRETAPGAAVATAFWLLLVKGFQFYLQVANPGTAYGAASSVLVFLVFLYLTSMGLIVGAMSAAVIVRASRARDRLQQQTAAAAPPPPVPVVSAGLTSGGAGGG
jgi:membrane protein